MDATIIDDIRFETDRDGLMALLRVSPGSKMGQELSRMCADAESVGRPKAAYKESCVELLDDEYVIVDGVKLKSRILRTNLESARTVYPFLLTSGMELEDWSRSFSDMLHQFWADTIKSIALGSAVKAFEERLQGLHPGDQLSTMNPGSLEDWPLSEQNSLFAILGNAHETVGVSLTESLMMVPVKSTSGIRFHSQEHFVNCQLCSRKDCPGRRAPYDEHLSATRYGK